MDITPTSRSHNRMLYSTAKSRSFASISLPTNHSLKESTERELFDADGNLCLKSNRQILCSVNDYRRSEISSREVRNIDKRKSYMNIIDSEDIMDIEARKLLDIEDLGVPTAEEYFNNINVGHIRYTEFNLGTVFAEGRRNISKDYQSAAIFFEEAANAGIKEAICELGYIFLFGIGVERDARVAASLFLRGAKRGDAIALCNLAAVYAEGNGVSKDEKMAVELFYRSYDAGSATAALNLGVMYLCGIGTEKCVTEAVNYFYFAAKSGKETKEYALHILSEICRTNPDAPKDLRKHLRVLSDDIVHKAGIDSPNF